MSARCAWCQQEECSLLVPVVNRDPTRFHDYDLVCPLCAEVASSEHTALWRVPLFTKPRRRVRARSADLVAEKGVSVYGAMATRGAASAVDDRSQAGRRGDTGLCVFQDLWG